MQYSDSVAEGSVLSVAMTPDSLLDIEGKNIHRKLFYKQNTNDYNLVPTFEVMFLILSGRLTCVSGGVLVYLPALCDHLCPLHPCVCCIYFPCPLPVSCVPLCLAYQPFPSWVFWIWTSCLTESSFWPFWKLFTDQRSLPAFLTTTLLSASVRLPRCLN